MSAKLSMLEELREGEYEVPYGRILIRRVDGGYKIEIFINSKTLTDATAKQIVRSFMSPLGAERPARALELLQPGRAMQKIPA